MENGNRRNLYLVTLCVSSAMVTLGVLSVWSTNSLHKFKNNETNVDINEYETSTMLSLNPVGFAVGSLTTGYIADRFGRRATILGSTLPIAFGSIIVVFAQKAWLLCITSFSWGCGTGMVSTVSNYYISEIADKDVRGRLSVITGFMFKFGNLLTMSAGPFLSYATLNLIILALPFLTLLVCWWMPETPYYCLRNGNLDDARKSLRTLRGYKDEKALEDELQALQAHVKTEMRHSCSIKELFVGKQYRRAIVIAAGLKLTNIMTGAVVIRQYLSWIIKETKLKWDVSLVFIIYGLVSFIVSMMSTVLVDRVGRRPLLVYSYIGTGVSLASVGIYFFLQEVINIQNDTLVKIAFIPVLGIVLATVISTLGFNSLIFIIPAEIFPLNVKAKAMTSLTIFGSALGFGIALGYQRVKDYCGFTAVFWTFASFAFVGSIFSYFFVTETKGKNLRDIQAELQGESYDAVETVDNLNKVVSNNGDIEECTEMDELKNNAFSQ